MDEDDIEAADIVIDLKMKIHDTPQDAARFAANGSGHLGLNFHAAYVLVNAAQ